MEDYYKESLIAILSNEDLDEEVIKECLRLIISESILTASTEDLEYRLNKGK